MIPSITLPFCSQARCGCFQRPVAMPTINVLQISPPYGLLLATKYASAFQIIASVIHVGSEQNILRWKKLIGLLLVATEATVLMMAKD